MFIEDEFNHLAAPQWEIPAQPETFFRGIEDEAREPPLIAVQIDDQASALLRHHAIRTAAFWHWSLEHSYGGLTSDILTGPSRPVFLFAQSTQALTDQPSKKEGVTARRTLYRCGEALAHVLPLRP